MVAPELLDRLDVTVKEAHQHHGAELYPRLAALPNISQQSIARMAAVLKDPAYRGLTDEQRERVLEQLRASWKIAPSKLDIRQEGEIRICYKCGGTCSHSSPVENFICFGCRGAGIEMVAPDGKWQPYWYARHQQKRLQK